MKISIWAALGAGILVSTAVPSVAAHKSAPKAGKVVTLADGLVIQDILVGTGASPKTGDTVTVDYVGKLTDGTVFDASANRHQDFQFQIGEHQVIKGWDEGVMSMKVGGTRKLTIPPSLGYGPAGTPGGPIPPNATLIFVIKLHGVQ